MIDFTKLKGLQVIAFERQLDKLQDYCEEYPNIAEFISPILTYGSEQAYCGGSPEANLGRQIIQHMWEINGMDLSSIGNRSHFDLSWVSTLNSFIGNYFLDDSYFSLSKIGIGGSYKFKAETEDMALQDPLIILEVAKVNMAIYAALDKDMFSTPQINKTILNNLLTKYKILL